MKWLDITEICMGLVLSEKLTPEQINPEFLAPPYGSALKMLQKGSNISDLYDVIGIAALDAAQQAGTIVSDKSPFDFVTLLEKAYSRAELAKVLKYQVKRLDDGEDADLLALEQAMERNVSLEHRYILMSDIDPEENVWIPTYYEPLDRSLGGVPKGGLTIIAAPPGVGKTSLALKIAIAAARQKKKTLFYTFEMTKGQLKKRTIDILRDMTSSEIEDFQHYIEVCSDIMDPYQVKAEATRKAAIEDISYIMIDFADLMLAVAEEEAQVALLYRTMATLAQSTEIPVILLSQLNRSYVEKGGIPRIHNIRWSGLAEAMAALILLIYNPRQVYGVKPSSTGEELHLPQGAGALIVGKSRFGTKYEDPVGAIYLPWDGELAWGDKMLQWQPLSVA